MMEIVGYEDGHMGWTEGDMVTADNLDERGRATTAYVRNAIKSMLGRRGTAAELYRRAYGCLSIGDMRGMTLVTRGGGRIVVSLYDEHETGVWDSRGRKIWW